MPTKKNVQNQQNQQPLIEVAPKQFQIASLKQKFIDALNNNGGNISDALRVSGLKRNAAYDHFKTDAQFAQKWVDAQENSIEELYAEARKRGLVGELVKTTDSEGNTKEYYQKSDRLLEFVIKQGEVQKKWRSRIIQAGNLALETIKDIGMKNGLTPEIIEDMQNEMTDRFKSVQLN